MRTAAILTWVLLAFFFQGTARPGPLRSLPARVPAPAERALQAIGWRPEDLHLDRADMDLFGGGPHRLPIFDAWIDAPLVIPQDVERFRKSVVNAAAKPSDLTVFAGVRLGGGVRRGLITDPSQTLEDSLSRSDPLAEALSRVWSAAQDRGGPARRAWERPRRERAARDRPERNGVRRRSRRHAPWIAGKDTDGWHEAARTLNTLPVPWRRPLALILAAEAEAVHWRQDALAGVGMPAQAAATVVPARAGAAAWLEQQTLRYVLGLDSDAQDPAFLRAVEDAAASVDLALMQAGATDLLLVLQKAVPDLAAAVRHAPLSRPPGARPLVVSSPLGLIAIGTAGADHYPAGDYLLVLDPDGADRYEGGAAGRDACPVSVLCDLAGDDLYATGDSLRSGFASGVTGIGILIDRAGDDRYRAVHLSQGAGLCGVGLLWDLEGNDRYDAVTTSQGAGLFGIGILADAAGEDRYSAFQQIQGYGYTLGCGLLVDAGGNDRYEAEDTIIRFPSAQSPEHNSTLGQGFGFGKRADYTDGHSLAGGFGFLADGGGDDDYRCGIFGQGAGYWYGIGVLADAGGDDHYQGVWYAQGSAAHFALGALSDAAGNDTYRCTMNMAQGAGHDFSVGMLYDQSGNDTYGAPNLSLGGGNANGIGIFWEASGDDRYEVEAATTLGRSNVAGRGGLRDRMKNLGLFLDTGGRDTYPAAKDFAGNDRLWTQQGTDQEIPLATEIGVGLDIDESRAEE